MGRGRSCGHHPVLPTTRGQKMIRHRRCGCDTKLCRDHCCAQCLSKLRGWPPASFPALHGQGLQRGLVQPVRLMPAPVVQQGQLQPIFRVFPVVCICGGQYEAAPLLHRGSRVGSQSRQSRSLQGSLSFPSRLCTFAPGVGASVLWPSRVVRISGWCAWCQKRSPRVSCWHLTHKEAGRAGGIWWCARGLSAEPESALLARVGA